LRVLVIQAEDSRNDRIEQVNGILGSLELSAEERELIDRNFMIVTPEHRADRSRALFNVLRDGYKDTPLDLLILNPAFAFIDGNVNNVEAVGEFLRNHLQEFCHTLFLRKPDCLLSAYRALVMGHSKTQIRQLA
jgi:RecA-family ATPase